MTQKGFEADITLEKTPNFKVAEEKPLKSKHSRPVTVDINILKARAQQIQDKENRKNLSIFIFFLIILGAAGIYFSV
jgi:hypothetical protein